MTQVPVGKGMPTGEVRCARGADGGRTTWDHGAQKQRHQNGMQGGENAGSSDGDESKVWDNLTLTSRPAYATTSPTATD
ncbi:hypothetical protein [Streptomyces sp. NPDC052811]|uniref:hypothetical protein n=1 Tax=Streptomyces sp. NPDC052811 TaxID=3155731 RepID=UPI00343C2BB4